MPPRTIRWPSKPKRNHDTVRSYQCESPSAGGARFGGCVVSTDPAVATTVFSAPHVGRRSRAGQSLAEFALIFPVLMMLVLAIGDFARWYSTAIAIESAAREAADFGAFSSSNWEGDPVDPSSNHAKTIVAMRALACTAASSLSGYEGDAVGAPGMSCTNPTFTPPTLGPACSSNATDPPCQVTVTLTYRFDLFVAVPILPASIVFSRDSTFAVSPFPSS